jgi:hypothetical protein
MTTKHNLWNERDTMEGKSPQRGHKCHVNQLKDERVCSLELLCFAAQKYDFDKRHGTMY